MKHEDKDILLQIGDGDCYYLLQLAAKWLWTLLELIPSDSDNYADNRLFRDIKHWTFV